VLNIMGGSDIDLNDAELSDRVTQLNVYSIMGGSDINVPHGVDVRVSNFALMGGNDVVLGDERAPAGGPTINIRMVSIMGGTSVRRGRKLSKAEKRELRETERRRELER
jgi:predicted membrane protein